MNLRCLPTFLALVAVAQRAPGQTTQTTPAMNPIGVWRGTSKCLVRPSPCHDEITVYRIATTTKADSVSLDALKIVNGQEEDMGVLACKVSAQGASLTCTIPHGVWLFTVRGDSLTGELRTPGNIKFRDVRAARSH